MEDLVARIAVPAEREEGVVEHVLQEGIAVDEEVLLSRVLAHNVEQERRLLRPEVQVELVERGRDREVALLCFVRHAAPSAPLAPPISSHSINPVGAEPVQNLNFSCRRR